MDHRHILDSALRELPAPKAAYLSRVADVLGRDGTLEGRGHLLYPVLAAAARGIEPLLPAEEAAAIAAGFLERHREGLAASLYSADYLSRGPAALSGWSARLQADLAAAILDGMAAGRLAAAEPTIYRFSSHRSAGPAFPYGDGEDGDE